MKKSKLFLSILLTVLAIFIFGCQNHLLPSPKVETPTDDAEQKNPEVTIWAAPENLVATHGLKGKIELTWKGVKSAARYYIYEAPTPYDKFIQVAETTSNTQNYVLEEKSGTSKYYKITAVKKDGDESPFSTVAHGTTLANPVITYIGQDEENSDSASSVHWYMNNCNASTYQHNVRYTINCFDPAGNNVAEKIHDGNSDFPSIKFEDLTPNTNYTYQVTAYIVSHQNDTEISDKVDSSTARRLRPNPPENLSATLGTSTSEITLSFELPPMVDVALGNGIYEPKPIYFKIYRRVASEEAKEEDWQLIEDNFSYGEKDTNGNFVAGFSSQYTLSNPETPYEPDQTVTYTDIADISEIKRGIMYEYKIQSYADETPREISSNLSYATTQGFLMAVPKFEITDIEYTDNELTGTERQYVHVSANHTLTWDNIGTEENYEFIVIQEKSLLEGDGGDGSIVDTQQNIYSTIEELNNEKISFDLSSNPENTRGYYKYSIYIVKKGETDINNAITSTSTIGQLLITNDVDTPKVKFFSVTNNYKDKIIVEWDFNSAYRYKLVYIEDGSVEENPISQEEMDAILKDKVDGDTISYTHITESGTKRSYKIYPTSSQTETNLPILTGSTLAIPQVENSNLFHEKIALNWNEIEADTFDISAKYQNSSTANANPIESVKLNVEELKSLEQNPFEYTFNNPTGFDKVSVSGLPIDITVKANKQVTKQILKLENIEAESIEEMYSISDENLDYTESTETKITTKTVGPALLNANSTPSQSTTSLILNWNKVEGATAYAIIRTQYSFNKNYVEEYKNTQKYLITENNGVITITSPGSVDDEGLIPANVKVTLNNDIFTLTDNDINNPDNTNGWQISQSQISWGAPYEYVVIPLVSENDMPEYDVDNSRPTSFVLPSVTYNNLPYSRTSAFGYGWNITATKGTYASKQAESGKLLVNDSIYITWKKPHLFQSQNPSYAIYRREENSSAWTKIGTTQNTLSYVDTSVSEGVVYEYQVGLISGHLNSDPSTDTEYIAQSDTLKDSKYTEEKLASGFILPKPTMMSASRNARAGNTELISWLSAQVGKVNNRMIDGYAIEVYNNNIDANWHLIKSFDIADLGKSNYEFAREVDNSSGLLKVLRDYKHYFRIRAFTKQDDKITYSKEPSYTWSDGGENNYVKWGCRQITIDEFTKASLIGMSTGMYKARGTEGCNDDGNDLTGLNSDSTYNIATDFTVHLEYNNYKALHQPKTNKGEVATVSLTGYLKARGGLAGAYQTHYWTHETMSIEYLGLSSYGTLKINGEDKKGSDKVSRNSGTIEVKYNGTTKTYDMGNNPGFTLPFAVKGGYLNDTEEWK